LPTCRACTPKNREKPHFFTTSSRCRADARRAWLCPEGTMECSRSVKRATRAEPPDHRSKWHAPRMGRRNHAQTWSMANSPRPCRGAWPCGAWSGGSAAGSTYRLHSLQPSGLQDGKVRADAGFAGGARRSARASPVCKQTSQSPPKRARSGAFHPVGRRAALHSGAWDCFARRGGRSRLSVPRSFRGMRRRVHHGWHRWARMTQYRVCDSSLGTVSSVRSVVTNLRHPCARAFRGGLCWPVLRQSRASQYGDKRESHRHQGSGIGFRNANNIPKDEVVHYRGS